MNKRYSHMPGYLKLSINPTDPPIIIFREDDNGEIILDPREIVIIKTRIYGSKVTLGFDSDNNYKFMRYEVLENNPCYFELKKVVDEKLSKSSKLEEKVRGS